MTMWKAKDRFFEGERTLQRTSKGLVDLPILYYDVRNVIALFKARTEGVRELLKGTGLKPGIVYDDGALVAVSFYEYRHCSIAPYNEVGTVLFTVREHEREPRLGSLELLRSTKKRTLGTYVLDLPVTTAEACAAGRELWGFPKFVTRIDFERRDREIRTNVYDPNGQDLICELQGTAGRAFPAPPLSLVTYSHMEGALVRTRVDVRGMNQARGAGSTVLRVGPSTHRMAENLRILGLENMTPTQVLTTDAFQSKLHLGSRAADSGQREPESARDEARTEAGSAALRH